MSEKRITLSMTNLILVVAVSLLLVLLWQLRSLIVVLMIAVVIAATLAPIIAVAQKLGVPRWLATILVYLGLIAILTGLVLLIGPTVVEQIQRLIRKLPSYLEAVRSLIDNLAMRFGMVEPGKSPP